MRVQRRTETQAAQGSGRRIDITIILPVGEYIVLLYTTVTPAPVHVSPSPYLHKIDKHESEKVAVNVRAVLWHAQRVAAAVSGASNTKRAGHANL